MFLLIRDFLTIGSYVRTNLSENELVEIAKFPVTDLNCETQNEQEVSFFIKKQKCFFNK